MLTKLRRTSVSSVQASGPREGKQRQEGRKLLNFVTMTRSGSDDEIDWLMTWGSVLMRRVLFTSGHYVTVSHIES